MMVILTVSFDSSEKITRKDEVTMFTSDCKLLAATFSFTLVILNIIALNSSAKV